ncbi:MAG: HAD family hydrolase [Sphingomonadales bacterium]|jgi:hypothetical protein
MTASPDTLSQIDGVKAGLSTDRPLIICDADEVLLRFVETLEGYLQEQSLYLRLDSFALSGNIRHSEDDRVVEAERVKDLMRHFFSTRVGDCPPVDYAVEALEALSKQADVVVLTNLPSALRAEREAAMKAHGMPYPVISNDGLKGAAVRYLSDGRTHSIAFLDDLPHNIASVAEHAPFVHRIHFIADERLRPLLGPAPDAHRRIDCWREAHDYLESWMNGPEQRDSSILP